jgi:hypothetical protein
VKSRNKRLEAISQVANTYAESCHTGDISLLRSMVGSLLKMYGKSGENAIVIPMGGLYANPKPYGAPGKKGKPSQCFITGICCQVGTAVLALVQKSVYGNEYTNHFQLLKAESRWLIVSKSYSAIPSRQQVPVEEAMALHAR